MSTRSSPRRQPSALSEELVRPWILPAVYERLVTGRGEFLAELRSAYPMFVRFGGIDYDNDPDAVEQARSLRSTRAEHPVGVRRQPAARDPRRQGRIPVRGVRHTACPRGRRLARRHGGDRVADVGARDRGDRSADRHRPRQGAQRRVRPSDASHVHVSRRRRQPLGPADVAGSAGSRVHQRRGAPGVE